MSHVFKLTVTVGCLVLVFAVVLGAVIAELASGTAPRHPAKPGDPEPGIRRPGVQAPSRPLVPQSAVLYRNEWS